TAGSVLSGFAEQQQLNRCSDDLGSFAGRPGTDGAIKSVTAPETGALPGRMCRKLHCSSIGLADLVRRYKQALTIRAARRMNLGLPGIRFVVPKPVLS